MLRVLLDENNELPSGGPRLVNGFESARVALQAVLAVQAGEWAYDLTFGVRWRGVVLRKFFDAATTREVMILAINTVPDIRPVTGSQIDIDTTTLAAERQVIITIRDVVVGTATGDIPVTLSL